MVADYDRLVQMLGGVKPRTGTTERSEIGGEEGGGARKVLERE
jgi:hypothetical protein